MVFPIDVCNRNTSAGTRHTDWNAKVFLQFINVECCNKIKKKPKLILSKKVNLNLHKISSPNNRLRVLMESDVNT